MDTMAMMATHSAPLEPGNLMGLLSRLEMLLVVV